MAATPRAPVHTPDLISIVVPVLDEERALGACLDAAAAQLGPCEVIVVDGGSRDDSAALAARRGARVIAGPRGRALQMNAGAEAAAGAALVFVHADTLLPADGAGAVRRALERGIEAGAFRLRFDRNQPSYRIAAWLSDHYCALSKDLFGDRCIFCRRDRFLELGGFRALPLLEDLDLAVRLGRAGARVALLRERVVTSARRFEEAGIWRGGLDAARLVLAFHGGRGGPDRAARFYRAPRR